MKLAIIALGCIFAGLIAIIVWRRDRLGLAMAIPLLGLAVLVYLHWRAEKPFDVYLVLDTSPSMLLPNSRVGMSQLTHATEYNGTGCAYACHVRVLPTDPMPFDSFWTARHHGDQAIELRIDAETQAARALLLALQDSGADHRMQTFGFGLGVPTALAGPLTDVSDLKPETIPDLAAVQPEWFSNGCPTEHSCNLNEATDFAAMFQHLDAAIPAPAAQGPARLMIVVTDGMSDEALGKERHIGGLTTAHLAQCAAIKRRGIRIAVLYLVYSAESLQGNHWSQEYVVPRLGEIEPGLARCASVSGGKPLLRKVPLGDSVPDALRDLTRYAMNAPVEEPSKSLH